MSTHELEIIEFFIEPIKGSASGAYYGVTEIDCKTYWNRCCINGKFLGADGLEFGTFAEMLENPGDYFPFCCSYCGEAGCDNIFAPIRCFHKVDEIILVIRDPLQGQCLFCEKESACKFGGDEFMCDMAHPVYRAHRFSKKQMRQALECKYNIK